MRTIILAKYLYLHNTGDSSVEAYEWTSTSRPSIEGYDVAILDLPCGEEQGGHYCLWGDEWAQTARFWELGDEARRLLQSGGVIVAYVTPVASTERQLMNSHNLQSHRNLYLPRPGSAHRYQFIQESTYDWLDWGFVRGIGLDILLPRPTSGTRVVAPRSVAPHISAYLQFVKEYWLSLDLEMSGDPELAKDGPAVGFSIAVPARWSTGGGFRWNRTLVLAQGASTGLPIALAVRYMNWDGTLILVPPPSWDRIKELNTDMSTVVMAVVDLASVCRQALRTAPEAHPDWAYQHRCRKASTLAEDIDRTKTRIEADTQVLRDLDFMLYLIDGTGDSLDESIKRLFDRAEEGILVQRSEKGAAIDLFVHDTAGRSLAIEVTGVGGKLTKNDAHWADFLAYLPEHHSKNEDAGTRIERIVLAVNTNRVVPVGERDMRDDITSHARVLASDNHLCVVRTLDLYRLWAECLEGLRSIQSVFDALFECEGIFALGNQVQQCSTERITDDNEVKQN